MQMDTRVEPPEAAGELETLTGFLDYFRATVVLKARGLSNEQGAKRLLPSLTTVSGLVQHLTDVERSWFRERVDGQQDVPTRWSEEDPDGEFRVSEADSLEHRCSGGGEQNVRWVLVHMIEETGRHCGHLDILRELLDGSTGD